MPGVFPRHYAPVHRVLSRCVFLRRVIVFVRWTLHPFLRVGGIHACVCLCACVSCGTASRYFLSTTPAGHVSAIIRGATLLERVPLSGLLLLASHIHDMLQPGSLFEAQPRGCLAAWLVLANGLGIELVRCLHVVPPIAVQCMMLTTTNDASCSVPMLLLRTQTCDVLVPFLEKLYVGVTRLGF